MSDPRQVSGEQTRPVPPAERETRSHSRKLHLAGLRLRREPVGVPAPSFSARGRDVGPARLSRTPPARGSGTPRPSRVCGGLVCRGRRGGRAPAGRGRGGRAGAPPSGGEAAQPGRHLAAPRDSRTLGRPRAAAAAAAPRPAAPTPARPRLEDVGWPWRSSRAAGIAASSPPPQGTRT